VLALHRPTSKWSQKNNRSLRTIPSKITFKGCSG
jgi:hypothetical protein